MYTVICIFIFIIVEAEMWLSGSHLHAEDLAHTAAEADGVMWKRNRERTTRYRLEGSSNLVLQILASSPVSSFCFALYQASRGNCNTGLSCL